MCGKILAYCQECGGYLGIRLYRKELEICGNDLRNQGLECGLLSNQRRAFVSAAPFLFSVRSREENHGFASGENSLSSGKIYQSRCRGLLWAGCVLPLPHFRNRPVTLKRFPDGVHGEAFYEKDALAFTPKWVKTFPVPRGEVAVKEELPVREKHERP